MKNVKIYIKPTCPFCIRVENYLKQNNIEFESIDVSHDPKLYAELKQQTGHMTVPQVFVDGEFIGGSDDFFRWIGSR